MNKNIYLLLAVGGVLVASTSCTEEEPNAPVSDLISYSTGADATFTAEQLAFPAKKGIKKATDVDTYSTTFVDEYTAYNVMWYNTGSSKYYLDYQPTYYEAGVDELVDADGNITQAGVEEVFVNSEFVPQPSAITNASNGTLEAFAAGIEACVVDGTVTRILGFPIKGTTATAAEVAAVWPVLEYLEVPLTSPVADLAVASEVTWLAEFMALVSSNGLRVDYIGASYYGSYNDLAAMKTAVAALESYSRPIVIAGFAATDVYVDTIDRAEFMTGLTAFMQGGMNYFESSSSVYAYAWDVDPVDAEGDLYDDTTFTFTTIGSAFMDLTFVPDYETLFAVQPDPSTLPSPTSSTATGYAYTYSSAANSDFESGSDSWTLSGASIVSTSQSVDLGIGLDQYLYDDGMLYFNGGDGSASQDVAVTASKYDQYSFGFVGRVQDADGMPATGTKLYMTISDQDGNELYANNAMSTAEVTSAATQLFSGFVTVKSDITGLKIKIVKEGGDATNVAFVDEVFVSYSGSALLGENLFVNGDLEAGTHDSNSVKNVQGYVTRSAANEYLFCDASSYMIYFGNTSNNYANFGYKDIAVEDGAKYRMSADMRLTSDLTSVPGAANELDGITPTGTDYYNETTTPTGDGYIYFQMRKGSNNGVVHYSGGAYYKLGGTYVAPAGSSDETYYTAQMAMDNGGGFHNLVWDYVVDYSTLDGYTTVSPFILLAKVKAEGLYAHIDNVKFQKVLTEAEADAIVGW